MRFLFGLIVIFAILFGIKIVIRTEPSTAQVVHAYKQGDFVRVKLTGDIGMVTERLWRETYVVTLKITAQKHFKILS